MAIQWDPKLSVGVRLIDLQHQELFRRIDALLGAMQQNRGADTVGPLLDFLKRYVVEHFAAEQKLMTMHSYPGLAAHEREHDEFVRSLLAIDDTLREKGPTVAVTVKLTSLTCDWLRNHMATTDRALGKHLVAIRAASVAA